MTELPIPDHKKFLFQPEPKHPAKFSAGFIDIFRELLAAYLAVPWKYDTPLVLDPFAGVGTIHQLRPHFATFGLEIEQEWAECSEFTYCADSTAMSEYWTGMFQAVCTSPTYGNRMADHHEASERCTKCGGTCSVLSQLPAGGLGEIECPRCKGKGFNNYQRNTYKHTLGHDLQSNNTGMYQFTQLDYHELHVKVYQECRRVLEAGGLFILNVSDHIRKGERVQVCKWHLDILKSLDFQLLYEQSVNTQRLGFGANRDSRVEGEKIYVLKKGPWSVTKPII
jgi:phage FluMu protein Com